MKNHAGRSVFLALILLFFTGILSTGCEKPDNSGLERHIESLERQLFESNARIKTLDDKLAQLEATRNSDRNAVDRLSTRLEKLEDGLGKSLALVGDASGEAGGIEGAENIEKATASEEEGDKPDLFAKLKDAIKREIEEEDEAAEAAKRKKQAERYAEYAKKDYDRRMKEFGEFAQKIGISASLEQDIRSVAEKTFAQILTILHKAWNTPQEEVDWSKVQEEMQEVYREAEAQIEPYVTEEQAKELKKYFGMNR